MRIWARLQMLSADLALSAASLSSIFGIPLQFLTVREPVDRFRLSTLSQYSAGAVQFLHRQPVNSGPGFNSYLQTAKDRFDLRADQAGPLLAHRAPKPSRICGSMTRRSREHVDSVG